jgi:hypothetical protein
MEETMNNLRSILVAILCMVLCSLISQGCNKDESSSEPAGDMKLAGTWKVTKTSSEYQGETETYTESQLDSIGLVWTFKIKDDGTVEQTTNLSGPLITLSGTWKTTATQLTMILTGPTGNPGTLIYEYAIDGNLLKLNWTMPNGTRFSAEFTKQG